jgi:Matrixin
MRVQRSLWLALGAVVWLACGGGGAWDVAALAAQNPALGREAARRLGEATPYLLPLHGQLTLFLCRWRLTDPLLVSLPSDASPRERALLDRALRAWQQALPELRFEQVLAGAPAQLEIRFDADDPSRTATTAAECGVAVGAQGQPAQLDAGLVKAHVALRRAALDWRDDVQLLSDEELLGSALHELGHALGYQGHARHGLTVMLRSVDDVRRAGRRLLAGAPFADMALAALYSVPSGSVVGRLQLGAARTGELDRLAALAQRGRFAGPYVRVGDESARIVWRGPDGAAFGFFLPRVREVLREPERLELLPTAGTLALLRSEAPH